MGTAAAVVLLCSAASINALGLVAMQPPTLRVVYQFLCARPVFVVLIG
jgi:hypothetical protein